ncbi:hypothetical protein PVW48_03790 [Dinoroseobacter sp. PD6]|uniref:hypothetical protein n=1 Tax=Dinoroseobacter sp. PD6 TaxID=3028384 RepID=UPI00237AB5A1|nr:hypothetical protein [Dinoroseobacter sp. PD6]MDD9715848.1 hypothetical protein [Dinoroseobacter sp. PD6]
MIWFVAPAFAVVAPAYLVSVVYVEFSESGDYGASLLFLGGAAVMVVWLAAAYLWDWRTYVAYRAMHAAAETSGKKFALVLRSFSNRDFHEREFRLIDPGTGVVTFHSDSLATPIQQSCEDAELHTVVIGGGLRASGRTRDPPVYLTYGDDDWRAAFHVLASGAAAILVFPEDSPSVRYELEVLEAEGLLSKTFFIAPPIPKQSWLEVGNQKDRVLERWDALRCAFASGGFELPEQASDGFLFQMVLEGDRLVVGSTSSQPSDPRQGWSAALADQLRSLANAGERLSDVLPSVPASSRLVPFDPLDVPGGNQALVQAAMIACLSGGMSVVTSVGITVMWFLGLT